jgi:hypothetical protein
MVEAELRKLEEKRKVLVEKAQEMRELNKRRAEVRGRQEYVSDRRVYAQKRWDQLQHTNGGKDSFEGEELNDQTLRWVANNGRVELLALLSNEAVMEKKQQGANAGGLAWSRGHRQAASREGRRHGTEV